MKIIKWLLMFLIISIPAYAQNRISNFRFSGVATNTTGAIIPTNTVLGTTANAAYSASFGSNMKYYITDMECGRTDVGTNPFTMTLSDTAPSVFPIPAINGGGGNIVFQFATPLVVNTGTALSFQTSTAITSFFCNFQGFIGQ
jgi:hypothetical protein